LYYFHFLIQHLILQERLINFFLLPSLNLRNYSSWLLLSNYHRVYLETKIFRQAFLRKVFNSNSPYPRECRRFVNTNGNRHCDTANAFEPGQLADWLQIQSLA